MPIIRGEWFNTYVLLLSFQFLSPHIILLKLKGRQATGRMAAYFFGSFLAFISCLYFYSSPLSPFTHPLCLPPLLYPFPWILCQSQGCTYVLQCRRTKKPASTSSVLNSPGGPPGDGGDISKRTGPLAVVRCRANYSGDGRALHARPFWV